MRVWIARDRVGAFSSIVWIHKGERPRCSDGDYDVDGDDGFTDYVDAPVAKKLFGFTPRKGTCKQYELTLKEIPCSSSK